jgi:hypothetical protein
MPVGRNTVTRRYVMDKLRNAVREFHEDEEGLETLQVVMIIAVAAVILLLVKSQWGNIRDWFNALIEQILGWTS